LLLRVNRRLHSTVGARAVELLALMPDDGGWWLSLRLFLWLNRLVRPRKLPRAGHGLLLELLRELHQLV
jgi:hypothetical protein